MAMMDVLDPKTYYYRRVFAAYNYYAGPKQIKVWPFNQHEGGGSYQAVDKLRFLHGVWR